MRYERRREGKSRRQPRGTLRYHWQIEGTSWQRFWETRNKGGNKEEKVGDRRNQHDQVNRQRIIQQGARGSHRGLKQRLRLDDHVQRVADVTPGRLSAPRHHLPVFRFAHDFLQLPNHRSQAALDPGPPAARGGSPAARAGIRHERVHRLAMVGCGLLKLLQAKADC